MLADPTGVRRIGVLGGTFDPVHLGHLVTAQQVAEALDLRQVIFTPAGRPWQKSARQVTDPEHRLAMVELAIADNPTFTVSRVDVDRPGATYAVDTLRDLAQEFPHTDVKFIVGADALQGFATWREPDAILAAAQLVAVTRPGYELADCGLPPGSFTTVSITGVDVSSSDCRRRVRNGHTLRYLVPAPVLEYIAAHGLYQS